MNIRKGCAAYQEAIRQVRSNALAQEPMCDIMMKRYCTAKSDAMHLEAIRQARSNALAQEPMCHIIMKRYCTAKSDAMYLEAMRHYHGTATNGAGATSGVMPGEKHGNLLMQKISWPCKPAFYAFGILIAYTSTDHFFNSKNRSV